MKHALLIGNCRYDQPGLAELATPEQDVQALANVLRDPQIGCFDRVDLVVNQPCADVGLAIGDTCAGKRPDDLLLIYYSGHGIKDRDGELCLTARDTRVDRLIATAYSA